MAKHVDLVNGIAVREETDDATGMTQKIVVDWRAAPRGNDLKPEIILVGDDGEPVRNDAGAPITYPMSVDAILSVEDGSKIRAGDVLARIPREGAKTKDITGGLPRVAELFEARRPKDHAIIAEIDGYVRFGATIRTSAASRSNHQTRHVNQSNTWCQKANTSQLARAISSKKATTSWMATLHLMTYLRLWVLRPWQTT